VQLHAQRIAPEGQGFFHVVYDNRNMIDTFDVRHFSPG